MPASATAVAERAIELFNRDMRKHGEISEELRALFVAEPVIVPFRAALEGVEYRGETALDDFAAASRESWSRLWVEPGDFRETDSERVLMRGELVAFGRESGAETRAKIFQACVLREGRIAELRTFGSEEAALAAVQS
jgi:hypothetical protein